MIYFDNAATGGQKPASVVSAVASSLRVCANPGRSGHALSLVCAKNVLKTRELLADVFNAPSPERVVFTKSCTEALYAFIFGALEKGDHVISTPLEHNSVLRPLERLKKLGVISYDVCPLTQGGNVCAEDIKALLRENTKLVVVTAASNVTGAMPPLKEIRAALPENVLFLCDGAQGGGHIPLKMQSLGLDGLALAGHKGLFAMQGGGALLLSERVRLKPLLYGGTGSESFSLDMPDFYPDLLEAGTLSYPCLKARAITSCMKKKSPPQRLRTPPYSCKGFLKFPEAKRIPAPTPAAWYRSRWKACSRKRYRRCYPNATASRCGADCIARRWRTARWAPKKTDWCASAFRTSTKNGKSGACLPPFPKSPRFFKTACSRGYTAQMFFSCVTICSSFFRCTKFSIGANRL